MKNLLSSLQRQKRLWKTLFWAYLVLLFLFVVIKFDGSFSALLMQAQFRRSQWIEYGFRSVNLVPLRTISSQLRWAGRIAIINLAANLIAFMPFGFLLPLSYPRTAGFWSVLALSLALTLGIETFQLVTFTGSFDVDDILLNVIGSLLGYGVFRLLFQKKIPGSLRGF